MKKNIFTRFLDWLLGRTDKKELPADATEKPLDNHTRNLPQQGTQTKAAPNTSNDAK